MPSKYVRENVICSAGGTSLYPCSMYKIVDKDGDEYVVHVMMMMTPMMNKITVI